MVVLPPYNTLTECFRTCFTLTRGWLPQMSGIVETQLLLCYPEG